MKISTGGLVVMGLGIAAVCAGGDSGKASDKSPSAPKSIHEFTVKDMDDQDVSLAKYKGDVCLIVNVASL